MPPEVKVRRPSLPQEARTKLCALLPRGSRSAVGQLRWGASSIQIPKTVLGIARAPVLCKRNEESDVELFSCREKSSCPFRASCGPCAPLTTARWGDVFPATRAVTLRSNNTH